MKIHLIFNAHIDPVWLWPWTHQPSGLLDSRHSAGTEAVSLPKPFYRDSTQP